MNIYDNLFEANDFYDREKLSWNYWLHVWQTYFLSPFHNAIAITTAALPTVTNVTIAGADTYTPGGSSVYTATVTGTNNPSQAVMWSVLGNTSSSTRMNDQGVLSVGAEEKEILLFTLLRISITPFTGKRLLLRQVAENKGGA